MTKTPQVSHFPEPCTTSQPQAEASQCAPQAIPPSAGEEHMESS